jgi:hypothetical protein
MTNAARQRRKYERKRAGLLCLRIEVHEHALAQALLNSSRLTADEALRRCGRMSTSHETRLVDFGTRFASIALQFL